jgi:hypothetical protein
MVLMTALLLPPGCSFFTSRAAIADCHFRLLDAEFLFGAIDILQERFRVRLHVAVDNPNPSRVIIDDWDLWLLIEGQKTVRAAFGNLTIEARGSQESGILLTLPIRPLGEALIRMIRSGAPQQIALEGNVRLQTVFGPITRPITFTLLK